MQEESNALRFPRRKVSGVVFDLDSYPIALEMRDLYVECVSHLIRDESFRMHVLMMPGRWGEHFVETAGEDPILDADVQRLTGISVGPNDCIVILGRDILSMRRTEDEMTEVVARDLADHINELWCIADRSTGWVGPHLARSAVLAMLTAAHPVLNSDRDRLSRQMNMTLAIMANQVGYGTVENMICENGPAAEAIGLIACRANATQGEYLSLPVRLADLVDAGRSMLSSIMDDMEVRPVGVI